VSIVLDSYAFIMFRSEACPPGLRARLAPLSAAHVPDVFDSEVMNVARHRHLAGRFDHRAVTAIIADLRTGQLNRHAVRTLLDEMWNLHDNLSMYHAAYVALAWRLGLLLVTTDHRLAATPRLPCRVEVY
jgi:predicted nucleic acid-binding protein